MFEFPMLRWSLFSWLLLGVLLLTVTSTSHGADSGKEPEQIDIELFMANPLSSGLLIYKSTNGKLTYGNPLIAAGGSGIAGMPLEVNAPRSYCLDLVVSTPRIQDSNLCEKYAISLKAIEHNATDKETIRKLSKTFAEALNENSRKQGDGPQTQFTSSVARGWIVETVKDFQYYNALKRSMSTYGIKKEKLSLLLQADVERLKKSVSILAGMAEGFDSDYLRSLFEKSIVTDCNANGRRTNFTQGDNGSWELDDEEAIGRGGLCNDLPLKHFVEDSQMQEVLESKELVNDQDKRGLRKFFEATERSTVNTEPRKILKDCSLDAIDGLMTKLCNASKSSMTRPTILAITQNYKADPGAEKSCASTNIYVQFNNQAMVRPTEGIVGYQSYFLTKNGKTIISHSTQVTFEELNAFYLKHRAAKCKSESNKDQKLNSSSQQTTNQGGR